MGTSDDSGARTAGGRPESSRTARISPPRAPVIAIRELEGSPFLLSRRRAPAGSVPGTLAIPADALPVQIRAIAYTKDDLDETVVDDPAEIRPLLESDRLVWLDVTGFGDGSALSRLGELLGIHPLAVADIVHSPQRPKLEDYGDRHLVVLQMGRSDNEHRVQLEQVALVLGPNWVATFQERPGDVFDPVRSRLRHAVGMLRGAGPDYLAYALIDAIVDGFFPVLEQLGEEMDDLEERVLETTERDNLRDVHAARRLLIRLHRVLWGQREAISAMLRDDRSPFGRSVHVYLRDTYDHSVQLLDLVETLRELTAAILELHLSSVNNRMNEVMKTLTVMASIFIPLTFIAGVYGMNFHYMPELGWRWSYPTVWVAMIAIAAALLYSFRRRGWLGDGDG